MQARISEAGDVVVVALMGHLSFESTEPFRVTCLKTLLNKKLIFDLAGLSFVGSSGLTTFVETLRELKSKSTEPIKFCGMGSEFRRLFRANEMADVEVYEDQYTAHASFFQPIPSVQIQYATDLELDETEVEADGPAPLDESPVS